MKKLKLKMSFHQDNVEKPVIYELIKKYNLLFNILHADINYGSKGTLITEIQGEEEDIEKAMSYLSDVGVQYETYLKAILRDEDECVDCGACTAVCPTRALSMNEDGCLEFDKEKCVVCELCISACPLRIIRLEL
ncbi:MAG: NIL domain-containing protein [Clostridia bacterium]